MMLISNIAMFGLGVYYIWIGTKSVDLLSANLGMIVGIQKDALFIGIEQINPLTPVFTGIT